MRGKQMSRRDLRRSHDHSKIYAKLPSLRDSYINPTLPSPLRKGRKAPLNGGLRSITVPMLANQVGECFAVITVAFGITVARITPVARELH